VPPGRRTPVIVNDPLGFYGAAGEVLHGLAALQVHNRMAFQVLQNLADATGEKTPEAALAAAGPDLLSEALRRVLSAAQQMEALIDGLNLRMTALLRLVERAEMPATPVQQPAAAARADGDLASTS
jgi:hypothetical protein